MKRLLVVGSGMAGLTVAARAQRAGWSVTVIEAQAGHGMDAHSFSWSGGLIDVPLRVMHPDAWASVLALAASVGVDSFPVATRTSCRWIEGETWFRSGRLPGLGWPIPGHWRYLNRSSWRLAHGLAKLRRDVAQLPPHSTETLAECAARWQPDPLFWRGFLLPVLTTICTCHEDHLQAWPAAQLLPLTLLILSGQQPLRRLRGGTPALVRGLSRGLTLRSGSPVVAATHQPEAASGAWTLRTAAGDEVSGDVLVVATAPHQADYLPASMYPRERAVLDRVRFDRGTLVVHEDTRLLPQNRRDWTALNFACSRDLSQAHFTVWVNPLEPTLADAPPVFQSWNPPRAPEHVIARVPLVRAVVHAGTAQTQADLAALHREPGRDLLFCGAWAYPGVPLLESAVRSGQAVADALGLPA